MTDHPATPRQAPRTFLGRLRGDVRGNTLAMMAIALVPVAALAGSGVDTARLYVVKVRLQQACDAGVLAGRKFMADSNASTLDANAATQAQTFFANNFRGGYMKTGTPTFTPAKTADSQVSGTASVTVPMTVMKMFAANDVTLNVTCEARYDVADADIMMVLDTTGSMACAAAETGGCSQPTVSYTRSNGQPYFGVAEKSTSKIKALRTAVLDFYDTVAGNADPSTHVRYGFVPYTSSVNAGAAIPSGGMLNTMVTYQSRRVIGDANDGASSQSSFSASNATCSGYNNVRTPASGWDSNGKAKYTTSYRSGSTCYVTTQPLTPLWRYGPWATDVSAYVAGNAVQDPSQVVASSNTWLGCIEERPTTASTSFDYRNLPPDLDPDLKPSAADETTRWRPMWPDQIWMRGNNAGTVDSTGDGDNVGGDDYWVSRGYATCGAPVQRLAAVSRSAISNYLNAPEFRPLGGTYHDVGMIWGTRMLSPNGAFGTDTAPWPGRSAPNRHLVFMTDGDMAPNQNIYGQYGIERYDQRVSAGDFASLTARHYARFSAVCDAAKARNITVWVVSFGQSMTSQLSGCATAPASTHAFYAANDEDLKAAFKTIANQVAMLRVSK